MTPPCLLPGELPPLAWGGSPHHMGLKDFMGKQAHGWDQVSWAIPSCQGLGQKLQHPYPKSWGLPLHYSVFQSSRTGMVVSPSLKASVAPTALPIQTPCP